MIDVSKTGLAHSVAQIGILCLDQVLGFPEHNVPNAKCASVAAASVSTLSESLPVQCTDGSVADAQLPLDSTSASVQPR